MPHSLRSRLILASILWTGGLLMLMHMLALMAVHVFPSARRMNSPWVAAAGLVLMAAGLAWVRESLLPFARLRTRLLAIRMGEARRVEGAFPSEVQPLIDNLNGLLADREKAVQRAIDAAADLAHGLKTPLALLAHEAGRAKSEGSVELSENIAHHVERMSRQIGYQLARTRAAASGSTGASKCPVAPCADALVRTLLKLHAGASLEISSHIAPDLFARVQREDLDEILGNLLDNACKWAKSKIVMEGTRVGGELVLTLDDDGPGLAPELRAVALERGVRLDEGAPGSGLGLAIVRDLCELYGGSVALDRSPLGGLRARVALPAF